MSDIIEVENKIIILRGLQVILANHVAELYGVETREISQAIKNNPEKFPEGYVFELDKREKGEVIKIFDNLGNLLYSPSPPKAFTEKGLYMLATILKSPKAVETTIAIVEAYAKLKELSRVIAHFRGVQVMYFGAHDIGAARRREDAARPHTALTSFACKGFLKYCVFDTHFML